MEDNTVLAREMFSSGCRPRLENAPVKPFSVSLRMNTFALRDQ